jgi:hypothetical protein
LFGEADRAGFGDALQPGGDIDAVAHEVAVALLDNIAQMNADTELNPFFGRQTGVALDHAALDFNRAAHRVGHAAELDDRAVAGALDDAAVMEAIDGSIKSLRSARSRASVRSSSAPASRL